MVQRTLTKKCKYFRSAILATAVLLTPTSNADIVATASTAIATQGIKTLLSDAIKQAEQAGDYVAFRMGTELRLSIEAWEKSNSALMDQAFSELSQQQQAFLTGTDRIASKLALEAEQSLDDIEDISNQWQNLVSSTILGDGTPVVSSYSPALYTPLNSGKPFRVSVKGANLNLEDPLLSVPDATPLLTGNTSVSLDFTIDDLSPEFDAAKTSMIETELTLHRPDDNIIKRWFGYTTPMTFKLPIMVGPSSLGSYTLTAVYTEDVERTENLSQNYSHSSGDVGYNCKSWNKGPSEVGRSIRNIKAETTRKHRAAKHEIKSSSSQGFTLEICAKRWTDATLTRVGTGPSDKHIKMTWQEVWTETVSKEFKSNNALNWGSDEPIIMPATTKSFVLTITSFDGRKHVFTGSGIKSLFDVTYDIAGKQVVISQSRQDSI